LPPHARKLILFACFALALFCATSRVRSRGAAVRRVTVTPENATSLNPTLSGDGRRLVFESTANLTGELGGQRFRAFAADLASDPPGFSPLAASRASAAALSQDGSTVAFASAEDLTGENADRNSEIFLFANGRLTQLTHTTPNAPSSRVHDGNFQPSISDDGHVIAFASDRDLTGNNSDANSEIFIYETSTGHFTQLTNTSTTVGAHDAKLSGDGSSVAFVRDDPPAGASTPQLDLVLCKLSPKTFLTLGENIARLALGPARSVSDDGARVVYAAETATNMTQVFLYDGRNAATRQLTHLNSRVSDVPLNPTISGDGSRVAFATRRSVVGNSDGGVELYLYDLPTNQTSQITDAPSSATAEVVASLDDAGAFVAFNFPRVLVGAVSSEEFDNDSEIFLASLAPRAPFSSDLKFRHGAIPNRDLGIGQNLAPGQIALARGTNLALASAQTQRLADGTFPRAFKNTSVTVNGRAAQIFFVSPAQVNFQMPDETEEGAAQVVVTNHDGYESRAVAQISRVAPGVFTERGDGAGAVVALDSATQARAPFDPHDGANGSRRITIFATGLRHAENLSIKMAGRELPVESVIPSPDLPGLEEVRVKLPRSLAGAGVVTVSITADGLRSNEASVELIGARRPARVSLSPNATTLGVGRSLHYNATVFDEDGEEIVGARVDFASDDARVATIDADGIARTMREGETRIRVSAGEVSAEATLRVSALSLVINEMLADPPDGVAGDANRDGQRSASQDEFVEIVNASDIDIDLGGHHIATRDSNDAQVVRHTFAPGVILSPGAAAVVFGGAATATFDPHDPSFAGAQVFTASTGTLSLLNGGDTIRLLDPAGSIVEEMSYGGATDLEGDRNQSLTRAPDVTGDFALHQALAGVSSRLFSPGSKTDGTPFQITTPVTRVEVEPTRCDARVGATCRFTSRAFDGAGRGLRGVIFGWQSGDESVATIDRGGTAHAIKLGVAQITATARGTRSAPAQLSVVPPPRRVFRVEVTPGSSSVNRGGSVQLTARAFDQNDRVVPDATFVWSTDAAAVATVDASGLARGAGVGVVNFIATTEDGAGGTESSSATLEVKLPIIISEVLADVPPDDASTAAVEGDANRDGIRNSGDDEFVELFNPSDSPVDLSGVRVADATGDRHTFPAGTTLEAGRALVVFGGGNPPTDDPAFGASLIRVASSLSLNDGGDTVSLKLKVGAQEITLASLTYGAQSATPAPTDQSLTRGRDGAGGLGASFVAHLSASNAAARAFSPGTLPDGTPFGSPSITRIEIAPASTAIDIGASQVFTARAFADEGAGEIEVANVSFAWDVSVPASAPPAQTSGATTTITARAFGSFTVRARAGGREAVAALIINPPTPVLTRVELSPTSASIFVGGAQQFTARAFDQFDHPYVGADIIFSSSDAGIAAPGEVTRGAGDGSMTTVSVAGLKAGAARIVASASASAGARSVASGEATLQVVQPPPVVKRVVVSPAEAFVNRGQTRQFIARAFDQNDLPVTNATFTWTTSDSQAATVSSDGLARGVGIGTINVVATTPSGVGQMISGQAPLTVRAPLVINEILADVPPDNANTASVEGDANHDGTRSSDDDEFVELLNNSDGPLDLSGVVVADSANNRFTFPAGTTLAAGQAAIIFGGGLPPARDPSFGGALVFTASSLGLNDGGDTVNVKLPAPGGDIRIASQSYGSGATGAPAAPSDQSLTRSPDAEVGSAGGGFVAHGAAARGAGRIFSPGTRADGTPFGSPPLTRIEVAPTSAQLDIGARQTFNARAFIVAGNAESELPNVSFVWDAGDSTKAALAPIAGASTTATAVAAGTTSVRAQAGGLQISASLIINPPPPVLTRVELMPLTSTIFVGQTEQMTARAFDQFDQPFRGATFGFVSDDANVARVESTASNVDASVVAIVSGRAAGTAHVTATGSAGTTVVKSGVATINVNPPPPVLTRVVVTPSSATRAAGETQQFNARGFDQEGREIVGLAFAWASTDQSVAAIDQGGLATAIKTGATQITAASGGVTSAPATLNVTAPPVAAAGQVVINEALVSFSSSTTQTRADFVELYNTTAQTLDISGLVVSFRGSGNVSAVSSVTLPGAVGSLTTLIQPRGYFLVANGTSTFGATADLSVQGGGFNLNNSTGGIKIEINGVKLDGLTYQNGGAAPAAPFNSFGEGTPLVFADAPTTIDLIRSPNATDTNNNATDFKRNTASASVTPKAQNP
jgi:uncharacterized protein (TIGR03437 family)